ncbi:hypothetical protein [Massilia sp. BJB1822]|uniref:hypothetical protein n=1 Tax=Massilia sp. BJB1822 TaxID=2744470 RepID=UPI001593D963|nr:hypothetical protein [Massilia sp. BJB1822]NVE01194.1 hypothetical protein [Massilia sp. BJB1822]
MNNFGLIDYREEFHLKTFRRWNAIRVLCKNAKFKGGVPLQKAAFVDFLLCNPSLLQNILVGFSRAQPVLNLEELLYQDNLEFGGALDVTDFSRTCILLVSKNYLNFEKKEGEVFLSTGYELTLPDNDLSNRWEREIDSLQPILSKSVNILSSAVLGGINGN